MDEPQATTPAQTPAEGSETARAITSPPARDSTDAAGTREPDWSLSSSDAAFLEAAKATFHQHAELLKRLA